MGKKNVSCAHILHFGKIAANRSNRRNEDFRQTRNITGNHTRMRNRPMGFSRFVLVRLTGYLILF